MSQSLYTISYILGNEDNEERTQFTVDIEPSEITYYLKPKIKENHPIGLERVNATNLVLYQVDIQGTDEEKKHEVERRITQLTKTTELNLMQEWFEIYPYGPPKDAIHIIAQIRPRTLATLKQERADRGLVFKADRRGKFTTETILLNDIHQEMSTPPLFVQEFANKLCKPRPVMEREHAIKISLSLGAQTPPAIDTLDPSQRLTALEDIELFHYVSVFKVGMDEIYLKKAFRNGSESFFHSHFLLALEEYILALRRADFANMSYMIFWRGEPWGFALVADVEDDKRYSYSPRSDWQLTICWVPCLHIQVVTDPEFEVDKDQMLIQAACLVRAINATTKFKTSPFVAVCIYINNNLRASRCLVYQPDARNDKVRYAQREFDLTKAADRLHFLVELYNFISVAEQWKHELSSTYLSSVAKLGLPKFIAINTSHTTESTQSHDDGNQSASLFDNIDVVSRLQKHGYQVDKEVEVPGWVSLNPLKPTLHRAKRSTGEHVILKMVKRNSDEVAIHKTLNAIQSPQNHTIALLDDMSFGSTTIIAVPSATILALVTKAKLCYNLARQLLEGVAFMHQQFVAHLDLKPENMVVSNVKTNPRLLIIDFGTAVRVKSREDLVNGYRGTRGWVAPEVGWRNAPDNSFSPISADLWACGKMLHWLLSYSDDSDSQEHRDLIQLANLLMDQVPENRPLLTLPLVF